MVRLPAKERRGASYAISALIVTATTITLVLVASNFVYQNLERQRGAAEFAIAKKAILAFDEALENVAWKPQSSRSTRFVVNYGFIELVPNALNLTVTAQVGDNNVAYTNSTGLIRYSTETNYVTFGNQYRQYILGDEKTVVYGGSESFGQAVIEQISNRVDITLNYRVCVMKTSEKQIEVQSYITYIDILIIRITVSKMWSYVGEFDLKARCTSLTTPTPPSDYFNILAGTTATISAKFGDEPPHSCDFYIEKEGVVVFNFVVADVEVSVVR